MSFRWTMKHSITGQIIYSEFAPYTDKYGPESFDPDLWIIVPPKLRLNLRSGIWAWTNESYEYLMKLTVKRGHVDFINGHCILLTQIQHANGHIKNRRGEPK